MAYEPTKWNSKTEITSALLNKLEEAVALFSQRVEDMEEYVLADDKTKVGDKPTDNESKDKQDLAENTTTITEDKGVEK